MRNRIILLILFAGLVGCKSKSSITKVDTSDRDSVRVETRIDTIWGNQVIRDTVFIKVKDPQSNNVVIGDPCDSLTGLLRKFEIRAGNTVVSSQNGNISIQTACDSIIEVNKQLTMSEERFLGKIKELKEQVNEKGLIVETSEKTGVVGWFARFGEFIKGLIVGLILATIFWFIMRLMGKV